MTGAPIPERDRDEAVLDMVSSRATGETVTSISARYAKATQYVSTATNRVRQADVFDSGDDPETVRGFYW